MHDLTPEPTPRPKFELDDMNNSSAMEEIEKARREAAAELRTNPSSDRFFLLARRVQAYDLALDALMRRSR